MQTLIKDRPRWHLLFMAFLSSVALLLTLNHLSSFDPSPLPSIAPGQNLSILLSNAEFDCNACEKPNVTEPKLAWEACLDRGSAPEYYMSIVIVTRSDDYAGDQRHRLQNMIDSTYILAMRTRTRMELLIVEWNPAIGRQRIKDIFRFRRSEYLVYRIISVPKKIHDTRPNIGNIPLHDYEGKNVGIRFARGEFILCTNQDNIWSWNMHNAVASKSFVPNMFYSQYQDRHDNHADHLPKTLVRLPSFPNDEKVFNACPINAFGYGQFVMPTPEPITMDNFFKIGQHAGDFILGHRDTWRIPRGFREAGGTAWIDMEFLMTAQWTFDIPITFTYNTLSCHQDHANVWENNPGAQNDNTKVDLSKMQAKEDKYVNERGEWGLYNVNIWEMGLECAAFRGGSGVL
ncbi:hypothetical protein K450DRAFT_248273 [Umbelopsis ramanniana AG]|uniref:Uncharacterized protein n=1 Tax=Umbelopsis ramanniana AG TaxID=1314678 RepID=A0AAD5E885_UMBRA|nr:uncharacterized protein K450DRAFT_248273 [Umbelopsis ramanniana AG]KAI8578135.1 hypothetical protein K450DRAFT_248273 [Umbelopsis ramanniana AG]